MTPILQIHPMMARAPDECHWMMRHTSLTAMLYQAPEYWAWLKQLGHGELRELYSHYRLQVQHLQLFSHRGHWVSKATTHLYFMPVLFDVFPDASLIRLHRHPCHAMPSLCNLVAGFRKLFTQRVDYHEIGATILDMFVDHMRRSMAVAPNFDRKHIIDIRYDDLVGDPTGTVGRIYTKFGYRFSAALEQNTART